MSTGNLHPEFETVKKSGSTAGKIVRSILLLLLAVAVLFGGSLITPKAGAVESSHIPTLPEQPSWKGITWYKVSQLQPVWNSKTQDNAGGPYLHTNSVYWSATNGSWYGLNTAALDPASRSIDFPVLGESYDYNFDKTRNTNEPNYKTRLALSMHYRAPSSNKDSQLAHSTLARTSFFDNAVGVYRGSHSGVDNSAHGATVGEATPKSPLSVFFWSYKNLGVNQQEELVKESTVPCPTGSDKCHTDGPNTQSSYVHVIFRIDDGSDTVWAARFPGNWFVRNSSGKNSKVSDPTELSGGEVDPRTGYIYFKSAIDLPQCAGANNLDRRPVDSKAMNVTDNQNSCLTSHVQFMIWDPATGRYTYSREIQPKNLLQRSLFYMKTTAWLRHDKQGISYWSPSANKNDYLSGGTGVSGDFKYISVLGSGHGLYRPMKGFSLTPEGDILLPVANATADNTTGAGGGKGIRSDSNDDYTITLVRIKPLRDAAGNFVTPDYGFSKASDAGIFTTDDSTPRFPCWTYEVVTKYAAPSTPTWRAGYGIFYGVAMVQGHFVASDQLGGIYDYQPRSSFPYGYNWKVARSYYPSVMLSLNTEESSADLISGDDPTNADIHVSGDYINPNFRQTTNGLEASKDYTSSIETGPTMSTPNVSSMISGVVRWDINGSGSFDLETTSNSANHYVDVTAKDSKDKPLVEGETVALYSGTGKLLQTTRTDQYGRYTFFPNTVLGDQTFMVRLVQPQVHVNTDPEKSGAKEIKEITDPDNPSKTVHVVSILQGSELNSPRMTKDMRNAMQTWALADGEVYRYEQVQTGSGDDTSWSLEKTSVRNNQPADANDGKKISVKAVCFVPKTSADSDSDKSGSDKKDKPVKTQDGTTVEGTTAQKWENCYGALQAPYKDPSLTKLDETTPISNMPILTQINVTMNSVTTSFDAQADFGITAAGSYGDAGKPFNSKNVDKGPYLTGVDPNNLHLGAQPAVTTTTKDGKSETKAYTDGTTDDTHATDDGVTAIGGGSVAKVSVSNGLEITVHGYPNMKYRLIGWLARVGSTETSPIHNVFTTDVKTLPSAPAKKEILPKDVVTEKFSSWLSKLPSDLKTSDGKNIKDGKYILRIMVVPDGLTPADSDNAKNAYDGPAYGAANASTVNWTNPGEIEDYAIDLAKSMNIIRFQTLIENRYNAPISMPQNVTYWPGGSTSSNWYRTVSIPAPAKDKNGNVEDPIFHPTIDEFNADIAANPDEAKQKLPQYTFHTDIASGNYEMLISDHLWYDARYQNPNSQAKAHNLKGMVCFRNDNPGSTELGNLMDLSDNENYHVMESPTEVTGEKRRTNVSNYVDTTKVTTDYNLTKELRININPQNLKRGNDGTTNPDTVTDVHDVMITCQIPLAPAQMILPNTGATAPWMLIVGGVLLLTALGGIATVLVLRRRN